ncbi:MAG TPA: oligosaccharide flippase family protein [Candidatus Dormibacteraeota bacterium]
MATSTGSARAASRLQTIRENRLIRQNLVLFVGGLVAGLGGFVYHAIATRILGPVRYGEVALLVALYAVGGTVNLILILVLARYAATLQAAGNTSGLRYLVTRSLVVLAAPALVWVVLTALLAVPVAAFEHLDSPVPVLWLGLAVAVFWYAAVPRGMLQGTQRFTGLSANLSLEMITRTGLLLVFLKIGLAVTGAMVAVLLGIGFAFAVGLWALRDILATHGERVPLRSMAGFAVTAAAGTLGVLLLYNLDIILAKHYLNGHDAGIYGALNKIGTILYFLTLSISQVLFPRVVEAVHRNAHPGRLLLLSAVIMSALGACALAVFLVLPQVVVLLLLGSRFTDAIPFVFRIGVVGLAIALVNLVVQFLMAVHDRVFGAILAGGCALLAVTIVVNHDGVGAVVTDVLASNLVLLVALTVRAVLLMPRLRPERVESGAAEAEAEAAVEPA